MKRKEGKDSKTILQDKEAIIRIFAIVDSNRTLAILSEDGKNKDDSVSTLFEMGTKKRSRCFRGGL